MTDAKTRAREVVEAWDDKFTPGGSRWQVLEGAIAGAISEAVEEERELNAKCCEVYAFEADVMGHHDRAHTARHLAATIRSRGPATTAPNDETHEWVAESHSGVGSRFHDEPASGAPLEPEELKYSSPPGKLVATYRRVDAPDALLEADCPIHPFPNDCHGCGYGIPDSWLKLARAVVAAWDAVPATDDTRDVQRAVSRLRDALARKGE